MNPAQGSVLSRGLFNGNNRQPRRPGVEAAAGSSNEPNFHEIDQLLQQPDAASNISSPGGFNTNSAISAASATQQNSNRFRSLDPYHIDNDDIEVNHEIATGLELANNILGQ